MSLLHRRPPQTGPGDAAAPPTRAERRADKQRAAAEAELAARIARAQKRLAQAGGLTAGGELTPRRTPAA